MTPSKAIKINCRFCFGGTPKVQRCESKCSFNRKDLPTLKRIQAGCLECSADHQPELCTGQLIGTQRRILAEVLGVSVEQAICPLHPFRLGKNPKLASAAARRGLSDALRQAQFKKKEPLSGMGEG